MPIRRDQPQPGFVRRLVHELRTPLASVRILAELLAEDPLGNLTPRQVERARNIQRVATELAGLLGTVSELAGIEEGGVQLEPEAIALSELVAELEEDFRPLAVAKELGFEVLLGEAPASVHSDRRQLRQLLGRLLDHAFSRTAAGTVSLHVGGGAADTEAPSARNRTLTVAVTDGGRAIPEEHREAFFEPLSRTGGSGGQGSRSRLAPAIAKALAELLGGELTLAGHEDRGCTLLLTLPVDPGAG